LGLENLKEYIDIIMTSVHYRKSQEKCNPLPSKEQANLPLKEQANLPLKEQANLPLKEQANLPLKKQANLPLKEQANLPLKEQTNLPLKEQAKSSTHRSRDRCTCGSEVKTTVATQDTRAVTIALVCPQTTVARAGEGLTVRRRVSE
jgi:hypothetical protein